MRRRTIEAEKTRAAAEAVARQSLLKTLPKGTCPKCLKHIGRGVGLHKKRCQG